MEKILIFFNTNWTWIIWFIVFCIIIWKGMYFEFRIGDNVWFKWETNSLQKQLKDWDERHGL